MTRPTFSPTVLLFDDDPAVLQMAKRRFYDKTSLGILTASSLKVANSYVSDRNLKFSAVIADLSVVEEKKDPLNNLNDGLDLLVRINDRRPEVAKFVLSVWADQEGYKTRATESGLDIVDWFQKLSFGSVDNNESPWHEVERFLYRQRMGPESDNNLSDVVRTRLSPPIRTYLQELGQSHFVNSPIEVICRFEEDYWLADPIHLGLLQSGVGETKDDALEDLGIKIIDQFSRLREAPEGSMDAVSIHILSQYNRVISIRKT